MADPVVILGCGYTGRRVAERLARRGIPVIASTREPAALSIPGVTAVRFNAENSDPDFVPDRARVLYSIPTLELDPTTRLLAALGNRPQRLVYISTTGVYGATEEVDHTTPPAPDRPYVHARLKAEQAVLAGPWSSIVLRPAAIYGPDRGIHISMLEGRFRMAGDGSNYVSRIHVDDLAAICDAALWSDLGGAWPVADKRPCTTSEIAEFCSHLFAIPMPPSVDPRLLHDTRRANRRVDGRAILAHLHVTLSFPTYVEGISAAAP